MGVATRLVRRGGAAPTNCFVETLGYAAVRAAGSRHAIRISLTEGQRRAVRAGRVSLAIAYGTCRTLVGQWEWLQTTNQKGSQR
jgi:hypothetical protein